MDTPFAVRMAMERIKVSDEETIHQMVRRVVYRTAGRPQSAQPETARHLVTEGDVRAVPLGGQLSVLGADAAYRRV